MYCTLCTLLSRVYVHPPRTNQIKLVRGGGNFNFNCTVAVAVAVAVAVVMFPDLVATSGFGMWPDLEGHVT